MTINFRETSRAIIVAPHILSEVPNPDFEPWLVSVCKPDTGPAKLLVIDCVQVKFMSSAVLSNLIRLHKLITQHSLDLRLINLKPEIQEVFTVTRLHKFLRFDDRDDEGDGDSGMSGVAVPRPKPPGGLGGHAG